MKDRLALIRDLLSPGGSVWVHMDNVEVHRVRCLLDETFGVNNFIATVVWQKALSRDNRTDIHTCQDQVLVYAKERTVWAKTRNKLPFGDEQLARYKNFDDDPRGVWASTSTTAKAGPGRRESQRYTLTTPSGREVNPPPGSCWLYTRERFDEMIKDGRIWFGKDGNNVPRVKRFLAELDLGLVPNTWWTAAECGSSRTGKKDITALFPTVTPFSTPKPERLPERIIHIASNPGDIIVDVFGGSGTTAAVAHKMGRRWITAELNPATVTDFIVPRLTRVVAGDDPGGITEKVGWVGGGGFRTVAVNESMFAIEGDEMRLAEWCIGEPYRRAVVAQLGHTCTYTPGEGALCGRQSHGGRGDRRLAVFDSAVTVGVEEMQEVVAKLETSELITIVGATILPEVEPHLQQMVPGSQTLKSPHDIANRNPPYIHRP